MTPTTTGGIFVELTPKYSGLGRLKSIKLQARKIHRRGAKSAEKTQRNRNKRCFWNPLRRLYALCASAVNLPSLDGNCELLGLVK